MMRRLLILFLCALPLCAQTPISLNNPSFEVTPSVPNNSSIGPWGQNVAPGWVLSGNAGEWQPAASEFTALPDGPTVLWLGGGSASQDTGVAALAGTVYTLTVLTGRRADSLGNFNTTSTISLSGLGGACSQATLLNTIASGTFAPQTLTCTAGTNPSGTIAVTLAANAQQVDFDSVRLTSGVAVVPILKNFTIFGGLRYCTLCDKSAGDDTVTGINLLAGLQVQLTQVDTAGKTIGSVIFTMDAAGNISGPDNITVNATNPLLFNVAVVLPGGMTLGSLAQSIAIAPFHLQGQGSLHVLIRLDKVTANQIRGVDWFSGA